MVFSEPPLVSDEIGIALITAVIGPVVILVLGFLLNHKVNKLRDETQMVKADTRATRHQVENNHDTNLREEGDERHDELVTLVKSVITTQKSQGDDIGGIRSELRELRKEDSSQRDRILDLEHTIPRLPKHVE